MLDTMPPKKQSAPAEEWPAVVRIPAELRDRLAALGEAVERRRRELVGKE